MGQEHGVRIPVPDLFGPDINTFAVRVDIDKKLGGIQDFVDSLHGMFSADDRKEGNRIQDKQEGTGNPEEIAHHQVCGPGSLQVRQAVKHIKGVFAFLLNDVMDVYRKGFKTVGQGQLHGFDFGTVSNQRFMGGEAEIDDIPVIPDCLLHIRFHEQPELGEI